MKLFVGEPDTGVVCDHEVPYVVGQYVTKLEREVARLKQELKTADTDLRVLRQEGHKLTIENRRLRGEVVFTA